MRAVAAELAGIAVLVFAMSSMLSVGLAYRLRRILRPLKNPRNIFRALVANFVMAPLLAIAFSSSPEPSSRASSFRGSGRAEVLGLGTAQRNLAGAMVIASRDFNDPNILVMVTVSSITGILILFPIAWLLSKHTPLVGLPTPDLPRHRPKSGRRQ